MPDDFRTSGRTAERRASPSNPCGDTAPAPPGSPAAGFVDLLIGAAIGAVVLTLVL
jgi:hypothetical protein